MLHKHTGYILIIILWLSGCATYNKACLRSVYIRGHDTTINKMKIKTECVFVDADYRYEIMIEMK